MNRLEVEPLDLGPGVKAIGLEFTDPENNREPILGKEAAATWSRVLPAIAGTEPWGLDFFSHLDRVRNYCQLHEIPYRKASEHSIVIPAIPADILEGLLRALRTGNVRRPSRRRGNRRGRILGGRNSAQGCGCLHLRIWYLYVLRGVRF